MNQNIGSGKLSWTAQTAGMPRRAATSDAREGPEGVGQHGVEPALARPGGTARRCGSRSAAPMPPSGGSVRCTGIAASSSSRAAGRPRASPPRTRPRGADGEAVRAGKRTAAVAERVREREHAAQGPPVAWRDSSSDAGGALVGPRRGSRSRARARGAARRASGLRPRCERSLGPAPAARSPACARSRRSGRRAAHRRARRRAARPPPVRAPTGRRRRPPPRARRRTRGTGTTRARRPAHAPVPRRPAAIRCARVAARPPPRTPGGLSRSALRDGVADPA